MTALPSMIDGMTRSGSAAANGMAPSVMNDAPSSQAAAPFSRSASVNSLGRSAVASAMASGGVMPAAMTAAMIFSCGASVAASEAARPAVAKVYATLLTGPPMSKRHHQAEDHAEHDERWRRDSPFSQLVSPSEAAFERAARGR